MVNDITIYRLMQFFPEIMDIDWISVTQRLHNHSSEYFCTFKIKRVDICKIMLMVLTISDFLFYYLQEHVKWVYRWDLLHVV